MNEKPKHPGMANLRPFGSAEEAREKGRKGGKESVRVRRAQRTMRETLKMYLNSPIPKTSPIHSELKSQMEQMGIKGSPFVEDMVMIGIIQKAARGSAEACTFLRDTSGEKPKDEVVTTVNQPPVVLGVFDPSKVEAERSRNEAMLAEMREAGQAVETDAPGEREAADAPSVRIAKEHEANGGATEPSASSDPSEQPRPTSVKPVFYAPPRR